MALPISTPSLIAEMRSNLSELDQQIEAVKKNIYMQMPLHMEPTDGMVYRQMDRYGKPLLADLLVAKSNLLSAIANLQASENRSRRL